MDQVSRPLQIVLVAALSFAALWFVALRPKDTGGGGSAAPVAPVKAPPANRGKSLPGGLGNAVDKARTAQGQENGAAKRSDQASNSLQDQPSTKLSPTPTAASPKVAPKTAAAKPTTSAVNTSSPGYAVGAAIGRGAAAGGSSFMSAPAAAVGLFLGSVAGSRSGGATVPVTAATKAAKRTTRAAPAHRSAPSPRATTSPAAVQRALGQGKVVVLLFWSNRSSDDRAVHSELSQVGSHGGRAFVASAPIRDVSGYGSITSGIQVLQSPTVVVVDRFHRATLLTGYTDHTEIGQAVASALAAR